MSEPPRPFRYHAVDLDAEVVLGTFPTQPEATSAVVRAGEGIQLGPGEQHSYAVRIESIASGDTYDIPLQVRSTGGDAVDPLAACEEVNVSTRRNSLSSRG